MRILQFAAYALIDLLLTVFACLCVNWWAPFVAVKGSAYKTAVRGNSDYTGGQQLPRILTWFDTFDVTLDAGWIDKYYPNTYSAKNPPPYFKRKWYQICWLYRNPAYGVGYYLLGQDFVPSDWTVVTYTVSTDGETYFHAVSKNGLFNLEYGGHKSEKLGWKAWNYFDPNTGKFKSEPYGPLMRAPLCATYNPFKD